jgi:hypothetical protein
MECYANTKRANQRAHPQAGRTRKSGSALSRRAIIGKAGLHHFVQPLFSRCKAGSDRNAPKTLFVLTFLVRGKLEQYAGNPHHNWLAPHGEEQRPDGVAVFEDLDCKYECRVTCLPTPNHVTACGTRYSTEKQAPTSKQTAEIPLSNGGVALVDQEMLGFLSRWNWSRNKNGYACAPGQNGKTVYMHRLVLRLSADQRAQHLNDNRLDNRKGNLRACRRKIGRTNKSPVVGPEAPPRTSEPIAGDLRSIKELSALPPSEIAPRSHRPGNRKGSTGRSSSKGAVLLPHVDEVLRPGQQRQSNKPSITPDTCKGYFSAFLSLSDGCKFILRMAAP